MVHRATHAGVRDGILSRNPAKDRARRRTVCRCFGNASDAFDASGDDNPRDLARPGVETLDRLVGAVIQVGDHQSWGDMVKILATTALRISEVSGLRVGDVDLGRGLLHLCRADLPGPG